MKRVYLLLLTIALIAISACTRADLDEMEIKPNPDKKHQTITIHADLPIESRAIHGTEEGTTSFSWQANEDQIGVRIDQDYLYGSGYRFTNITDGDKATFVLDPISGESPSVAVGSTFVSYYPYGTALFFEPSYDESWIGRPILRNALGSLLQIGDNNTEHLYRGDYMFSRPITLTEDHFDSEGNVNVSLEFGHIFSKMRFTVKNSTSKTQNISSLIYRSTKDDDVMMGTLYLDASTGEFLTPTYYEWGDVTPNNSSVLEVQDVSIAPGESAILWMWVMPHDFTEGNADGRKADIMVNTQEGVFRVQDVHFNQRMIPGRVYRQGLELTDAKLLSGYGYVSDPNFVRVLYNECMCETYDSDTDSYLPAVTSDLLYDLSLTPYTLDDEEAIWSLNTGCYIKISEAEKVERLNIGTQYGNALSLDGLQYFTALKELSMALTTDVSSTMSIKSLNLSTLTKLETIDILAAKIFCLDVTHNTNLQSISLGSMPLLEEIRGLDKLTKLWSIYISEVSPKFEVDLSNNSTLKYVGLGGIWPDGKIDISNLQLDYLAVSSVDNIISNNLSVTKLDNASGEAFPSGAPLGVKELIFSLYETTEHSMFEQLSQMTEIEVLEILIGAPDSSALMFTSAQSSVKTLKVSQDSSEYGTTPPSGWQYMTGVENLEISSKWSFTDSNPLDLSAMSSLQSAMIKVKKLTSFSIPSPTKVVNLNIYNTSDPSDIVFSAEGVEDLEILTSGTITIGSCPKVKELYLIAGNRNYEDYSINLGSCPLVEDMILDCDNGDIKYESTYPKLTSLQLDGRRVRSVPSADITPAIESLYIGHMSTAGTTVGIGAIDLTGFTNLIRFRVPHLDETGYYSKYNNRYYNASNKMVLRGAKAFTITEAQLAVAKANAKAVTEQSNYTLPMYEGIDYEAGTPAYYKVNTVYKVVNSAGEEVSIEDTDASDGECTSLVISENTY